MRIKTILFMFILSLFLAGQAWAGGEDRIGSAGAQELRIPIGARGAALGGSVVADVSGVDALYWNPAGVAEGEGTQVAFSYLKYIADIGVSYLGATTNLKQYGTLGLSVKIVNIGDIEATSETSPNEDLTTGEIFTPAFAVLGLTYSRQMSSQVSFGITGKFINEKIWKETATGFSFDFGFLYDPEWLGLRFGVMMKDFGPDMSFSGPQFEKVLTDPDFDPQSPGKSVSTQSASFELPSYVQLGVSYDLYQNEQNKASAYGLYQSNNFSRDEGKVGLEYSFKNTFFLRGGYASDFSSKEKISGTDQQTKTYIYGLTLGAGVKTKLGGTSVAFDYSWTQTEFFDDNQFFTLTLGF
jgi:hypothetical protein